MRFSKALVTVFLQAVVLGTAPLSNLLQALRVCAFVVKSTLQVRVAAAFPSRFNVAVYSRVKTKRVNVKLLHLSDGTAWNCDSGALQIVSFVSPGKLRLFLHKLL